MQFTPGIVAERRVRIHGALDGDCALASLSAHLFDEALEGHHLRPNIIAIERHINSIAAAEQIVDASLSQGHIESRHLQDVASGTGWLIDHIATNPIGFA